MVVRGLDAGEKDVRIDRVAARRELRDVLDAANEVQLANDAFPQTADLTRQRLGKRGRVGVEARADLRKRKSERLQRDTMCCSRASSMWP